MLGHAIIVWNNKNIQNSCINRSIKFIDRHIQELARYLNKVDMNKQHNTSVWSKSLNWLANHTYRQIPALIGSYAIKSSQSQCLCFEDYIRSPHLAREAGLMCIRQMKSDFIKRKEGTKNQ